MRQNLLILRLVGHKFSDHSKGDADDDDEAEGSGCTPRPPRRRRPARGRSPVDRGRGPGENAGRAETPVSEPAGRLCNSRSSSRPRASRPTGCNAPTKASGRSTWRAAVPARPADARCTSSSYEGKLLRELAPEGHRAERHRCGRGQQDDLDRLDLRPRDHPRGRKDRRDHRKALHARGGCHLSDDHGRAAASGHVRPIGASSRDERTGGRAQGQAAAAATPGGRTLSGQARRTDWVSDAAAPSPVIPARLRRAPARTESRPKPASSGWPYRRLG